MAEISNKNVIIVNDYDYIQGGATKVAVDTANLLVQNGYNVTFFCGVSDKEKSILDERIRVIASNKDDALSGHHYFRGLYNSAAKRKFAKLLEGYNPTNTIIHIHGWTKALTGSFIIPAYKKGFKSILTVHDYFTICPNGGLYNFKDNHICTIKPFSKECKKCDCDSRNKLFKKYRNIRLATQNNRIGFVNKISHFITISKTSEDLILKELPDIKYTRIYNFVNVEKKERIKFESNQSYVYVGRIDKEKGVDLLCEAFSKLDKKLLIIGSGSLLDSLREEYKDSSNIEFLGWKSGEEVLNYMKTSRALIMPSIWYEGAPLTAFESMSIGLPMIVSSYCSGKEFIDQDTGWCFDPFNIYGLINIIDSITDADIKNKSEKQYKRYWDNPFSKERYLSSLNELYNKLLGE